MTDATPLTGEHLALDLVNTRTADGDVLATPQQLRDWLALQGARITELTELTGTQAADLSEADLLAVRSVRDDAAAVLRALLDGHEPPASALAGLTDAQHAAPAVTAPAWDGSAVVTTRRRAGGPGARLAAALAEAAAELAADPAVARLRECEAGDCVLLFVPAHPRRRWCSAARCGNRVRVARHYRRRREG
ncbi:CGNR zinc finger domain-containing protein [Phytomonospora sp. NPDC050363]|uniref:CGNR zinc finger domain-containing protein n=1 Tax=Phytomonospora sp. NPDC050363 TaxID=3155642 RepID=UPI0033E55FD7